MISWRAASSSLSVCAETSVDASDCAERAEDGRDDTDVGRDADDLEGLREEGLRGYGKFIPRPTHSRFFEQVTLI